jgi:1-acyl-sn-glycerol-3-phosphate acyltransferase
MLYAILKPLAVLIMRLYFGLDARGAGHVPASGPVLIVANHSSVLDPPFIGGACARPLCFMAKAELFDVPLFGRLIRALNARPVRREGADARALKDALRVLEQGEALLVFPEGTRGEEGVLREGKAGAGMLAVMSGATVVPVYIGGTGRALPRGRSLPRPSRVRVTFGPPMTFKAPAGAGKAPAGTGKAPAGAGKAPQGEGRKEHYRAATAEMMRAIAQLREVA